MVSGKPICTYCYKIHRLNKFMHLFRLFSKTETLLLHLVFADYHQMYNHFRNLQQHFFIITIYLVLPTNS